MAIAMQLVPKLDHYMDGPKTTVDSGGKADIHIRTTKK
jgi:hypothetical protein